MQIFKKQQKNVFSLNPFAIYYFTFNLLNVHLKE